MTLNIKTATALMEQMNAVVEGLEGLPQMVPIAQEILLPVLNGKREKRIGSPAPHRSPMSAARRKAMSIAAKKRWAKAKRAGKNTIGGAD